MSPRWGGFAPIRKRDQGSPRPAHHGEMALIVGISRYHAWMERDWTSMEGRSAIPPFYTRAIQESNAHENP
jgi:hypothetical protein